MQQIGVGAARGTDEAGEQRGNEQGQPGPPPQIPQHPVAVRDPEVAELLRPDDLDVDAPRANVVDRVRDETPCGVTGGARIRRRQHCNAHQLSTRKTA
jgi:hypothetical protein